MTSPQPRAIVRVPGSLLGGIGVVRAHTDISGSLAMADVGVSVISASKFKTGRAPGRAQIASVASRSDRYGH